MRRVRYGLSAIGVALALAAASLGISASAAPDDVDPATLGMRVANPYFEADRFESWEAELNRSIPWFVAVASRSSREEMRRSVWGQFEGPDATLPSSTTTSIW